MSDILPTELLYEIFSHLDIVALKQTRRTNRRNNYVCRPLLFAQLRFKFDAYGAGLWLQSRVRLLETLRSGSVDSPAKFVKNLDLVTPFEAPWDSYYSFVLARYPDTLKDSFNGSIPYFTSLKHVQWKITNGASAYVFQTAKLMAEHCPIESFALENFAECPPCFADIQFPHLQSLTLSGNYSLELVSTVCALHPHLRRLSVTSSHYEELNFEFLPEDCEIEALVVGGALAIVDLPVHRLKNLQLLTVDSAAPSHNEGIWSKLEQADVRLQELRLPEISEDLLHYLASYSGLEVLDLTIARDSTVPGTIFWMHVLPRHERTLQRLALNNQSEADDWYISKQSLQVLKECRHLSHITDICSCNNEASTNTIMYDILDAIPSWPCLVSLSLSCRPREMPPAIHPEKTIGPVLRDSAGHYIQVVEEAAVSGKVSHSLSVTAQ
ncbi:hypothetical protein BDZ89DRAFT_765332 [Hymenopellis radicata]|nr:hypothetical protein BDZ89DRAFT_765332 [Hymenopellis radicata]